MEVSLLRFFLSLYMVTGFALALLYLRHRRVTPVEYLFWGTLALTLPVFGPFFVIVARPGPRRRKAASSRRIKR